jgi:hypothetical protein
MGHLFAAVLLLSSPGCPHEESTCLTPTEYVEVHLSTRIHVSRDHVLAVEELDPQERVRWPRR